RFSPTVRFTLTSRASRRSPKTSGPTTSSSSITPSTCLWLGCGGKEIYRRRLQVVHRPGDLDGALGLERGNCGTTAVNPGHGELDILPSDRVDEGVVLDGTLALIRGGIHSRPDLREQAGEVAELDPVDGALDRAAGRVAHHQDDLRTDDLAGELDASEDVVVGD